MKAGWQQKKLVEVATLQRGFDLPTQDRVSGDVPLVTSSGVTDTHNKIGVRGPGVATGRSGSIGNVFFIEEDFWALNTVLYVKDFHGNDPRFVFHLLKNFNLKRFASGVGVPTLNRNFVHDELVDVPPLPEQHRIVAILDEAFDGIATAKANAEKNLQNARALFESHLQSVFTERGEGWVDRPLGTLCDILDNQRKPITKRDRMAGVIPYYGATGIQDYVKDYIFDEPLVLVGEDGAKWQSGERTAFAISGKSWVNNHAHVLRPHREKITDYWLISFLTYSDLTPFVSGLTVQKLNQGNLREIPIPLPPLLLQQELASNAEALEAETQRLESLYQQKLVALDDLKKSLLHEAFSGQL